MPNSVCAGNLEKNQNIAIYIDINVEVTEVRQGDAISPKLFSVTVHNVMRTLE
ncbi:hypothetical protein KIN20_032452 [Parelaphostrongylus tenuis]|uniref:Uncharacterized protein n=1 Tax=Parelaphostrongylus tenuis TaxID=148309 RepID=A0AAD5R709_PARTN|nr:hypothetical protein KIN20_032452 [Parelaphostrongylus tenuis]